MKYAFVNAAPKGWHQDFLLPILTKDNHDEPPQTTAARCPQTHHLNKIRAIPIFPEFSDYDHDYCHPLPP
jgi:hypothetical protein